MDSRKDGPAQYARLACIKVLSSYTDFPCFLPKEGQPPTMFSLASQPLTTRLASFNSKVNHWKWTSILYIHRIFSRLWICYSIIIGHVPRFSISSAELRWFKLSWNFIVPLFGTTKLSYLEEDLRTADFTLTPDEIKELETKVSAFPIVGARYDAEQQARVEY